LLSYEIAIGGSPDSGKRALLIGLVSRRFVTLMLKSAPAIFAAIFRDVQSHVLTFRPLLPHRPVCVPALLAYGGSVQEYLQRGGEFLS
jgi:hypothetical protein